MNLRNYVQKLERIVLEGLLEKLDLQAEIRDLKARNDALEQENTLLSLGRR